MQLVLEGVLLVVESLPKSALYKSVGDASPEEEASLLGRCFFSWVNATLIRGYTTILGVADLPPLDRRLRAAEISKKALRTWEDRGNTKAKG